MGIQMHCYRRGATYQWRRRLPAELGGAIIQISLRTNDPLIAKRLALIVGAQSCEVFDAMSKGLSRDDAKRLLEGVIRRELEKILKRRLVALEINTGTSPEEDRKQDLLASYIYARLAERGLGAHPLSDADKNELQSQDFDSDQINQADQQLHAEAQAYQEPPEKGLNHRSKHVMSEVLARDIFNQWELMEGRQIHHKALAEAYFLAGTTSDLNELRQSLEPMTPSAPPALTTELPEPPVAFTATPAPAEPIPVKRPRGRPRKVTIVAENGYDPSISALAKRLMDLKRDQGMSPQMIEQMTRVYEQLSEITGVQDIRELKQKDLSHYRDILRKLPKSYRRSPKDKTKSLDQILSEAKRLPPDQCGLSPQTINRNFDYIGQLLTKARGEGFTNAAMFDLNSLRMRKNTRDRDERPAFTPDDVQKLFSHPIWQGNQRKNKWNKPGPHITKDGIYWVPLIAAFTGARREEIAALKAADILEIDGIAVMRLSENDNRGVKTFASTRDIPLHPQLIEQGLMEHAASQLAKDPKADLFPELRRKDRFGAAINYKFRQITESQLAGNPEGKVFHSFRHYVATMLGQFDDVRESTRKDILGHVGGSITEERYTMTAPLAVKLTAICKLPRLPLPPPT